VPVPPVRVARRLPGVSHAWVFSCGVGITPGKCTRRTTLCRRRTRVSGAGFAPSPTSANSAFLTADSAPSRASTGPAPLPRGHGSVFSPRYEPGPEGTREGAVLRPHELCWRCACTRRGAATVQDSRRQYSTTEEIKMSEQNAVVAVY